MRWGTDRAARARALEWTILTTARTGETIGAQWSEIDRAQKLWVVPAGRMKAGKEHRVPLSERALAVLEATNQPAKGNGSEFLFPGQEPGLPLSNMAMLKLLARMQRPDLTTHGFRSSFRDWAGDCTKFDRETIEFALAHGITDKTEAAYRRSTAVQKRRELMEDWAKFCGSKPASCE